MTDVKPEQISRNGTYMQVGADDGPAQVHSGVKHLLEPGSIVHLGSADVWFRYEMPLPG